MSVPMNGTCHECEVRHTAVETHSILPVATSTTATILELIRANLEFRSLELFLQVEYKPDWLRYSRHWTRNGCGDSHVRRSPECHANGTADQKHKVSAVLNDHGNFHQLQVWERYYLNLCDKRRVSRSRRSDCTWYWGVGRECRVVAFGNMVSFSSTVPEV